MRRLRPAQYSALLRPLLPGVVPSSVRLRLKLIKKLRLKTSVLWRAKAQTKYTGLKGVMMKGCTVCVATDATRNSSIN